MVVTKSLALAPAFTTLAPTQIPADARGYFRIGSVMVDVTRMNPSLEFGASEMVSTTADVVTFLDALLGGKLTSQTAIKQMRTLHDAGSGMGYGLGLRAFPLPCGDTVYGHSGGA
ncbi:D-alanyl-D-alanine carboxypeptidase [Sinosporangium album]|uniref:D-alanyl-D-alanine carboxypeptidase n=2 Tax=Sinosporangium album TaxID=504805 RepID=A0A1G8H260_9ACTN|nr:D-alanyl-D-alanine carboxypeptidase [Sinosporangium album]